MLSALSAALSLILTFIFGSLFSFSGLYTVFFKQGVRYEGETGKPGTSFPITCYFSMDSSWPDNGTMHPAMNSTLCTHLIFIGSKIADCKLVPANTDDPSKYYNKIPILKKQNPALKVLLSNGGNFGPVLASAANRSIYVQSTIPFLHKYGFDGLDLDWEFPGWPPNPIAQRPNFTMLVQELRRAYDAEVLSPGQDKLLLTAAVAAGRSVMLIYDIPALAKELDYINLMGYDYHSFNSPFMILTDYNSPLYPKTWRDKLVITSGNLPWSAHTWNVRGMPKSKILVGVPTYEHAWKLEDPKYHGRLAPATGTGKLDFQSYPQMCDFLKLNGSHEVFDEDAAVPYAYNGEQWISYENVRSMQMKADWVVKNGYGGMMVFSLNADDIRGHCDGHTRFPLVSALVNAVHNATSRYQSNKWCHT